MFISKQHLQFLSTFVCNSVFYLTESIYTVLTVNTNADYIYSIGLCSFSETYSTWEASQHMVSHNDILSLTIFSYKLGTTL